ncbi:unnamed protein product [Penicillium salamii]|uniref:Uncharacterized protein n=1 Tax=Penicillium salamii TaxID=1612424 RepID=A0A9W4I3D2_9EURO|nr:unnamed protein product [Penicillium salamii]CAG8297004.1 unnamed protein product [Penicillium salamii]CAG8423557.1 unnamed protein product [Penicillium salamii]
MRVIRGSLVFLLSKLFVFSVVFDFHSPSPTDGYRPAFDFDICYVSSLANALILVTKVP